VNLVAMLAETRRVLLTLTDRLASLQGPSEACTGARCWPIARLIPLWQP
jgi:hypothetical protein